MAGTGYRVLSPLWNTQVTEQQLRSIFVPFGDIVYVKIPSGKGCGFVQFSQRSDAETAMLQMNGQVCPREKSASTQR